MGLLVDLLGVLVSSWFHFRGLKNNKNHQVTKTQRIHELISFF
jgi:hypothetical protein